MTAATRIRILVADDDLVSRMAMEDTLRGGPPADVTIVEDGAAAWQALKKGPPFDLVCLDVRMPPPDGLELAERIRHTPAFRRLPVMLITSTADRNAVLTATRLQLQGFIVKPVNAETASRITKVVEQLDLSVLEAATTTIARLRIDASRHARYVQAYLQQMQALSDLAAQVDAGEPVSGARTQFIARSDACRTAALTIGSPRIEGVIGDAVQAAQSEQPGAAAAMAQAMYWLRRVAAARGYAPAPMPGEAASG